MTTPRAARLSILGLASALLAASSAAQPAAQDLASIRWAPFVGEATDGAPLRGELGRLLVPENRDGSSSVTIEIAFVRYRTTNPHPGPPVFFIAGGPGASGVRTCAIPATHPQIRLLEHADVIGIDQRGTGLSSPDLFSGAEFTLDLPLDCPVGREEYIAAARQAALRCMKYWNERGVDPASYNTRESAADIEAVRRALGCEQIVLYGTSYGSHLSIAYLRDYSAHVARAILTRVEGPNDTWKLPSIVQRGLERLHEQAAESPTIREQAPDLLGQARTLFQELRKRPATVTLHSAGVAETTITLGEFDLKRFLARALAETPSAAGIPAALVRFARGDWTELAHETFEERRISVDAMPLFMDCASGGNAERLERIERERRDPLNLLEDAIMAPLFPEVCEGIGCADLGDGFRAPPLVSTPVLFVSGALDVRTPPENVDEIREGFTGAAHVIVSNTRHDARELMSPEYRDLMQAFLRGEPVSDCAIVLPPATFSVATAERP